ncbi:MAG: hypothetical protein EBS99_16840, partial [Betaproteobacteria bacterium]|nr:hypothetical protein [Betaproteobacteria bacterium]
HADQADPDLGHLIAVLGRLGFVQPTQQALAALLGLCFAAWLYGWRVIDPTSVQWLLHGDPAQHYIGSVFFRDQPWHWPLGLIDRFGDAPTSVVFTDSIPLLALATKLLGQLGLWPAHWQYFGLWMLACHALAGWYAVVLLERLAVQGTGTHRTATLLCAAFFFITAPMLLLRAYGHEALMAHFVVLGALALCVGAALWRWKTWLTWCVLALLVHPYLALMVAVLGLGAAVHALQTGAVRALQLLRQGVVAVLVLGAVAWLAGYTVGQGQRSAFGFGFFSANLLSWIDPMDWHAFSTVHQRLTPYIGEWSALLPAQAQATGGQYEGFAYLGAGMLLLWVAALAFRLPGPQRPAQAIPASVWVAAALLALWAVSNVVTLGANTLVTAPLPAPLDAAAGVFRASGRFVWPLSYLLMAVAIAHVTAHVTAHRATQPPSAPRAWPVALLAGALLLQLADLHGKYSEFRARFRVGPPGIAQPLQSTQWAALLARCPRVQMLTLQQELAGWEPPALAAATHGARFAPAPTARAQPLTEEQRRDQVLR